MKVTRYEKPLLKQEGNLVADLYNPAVDPETPSRKISDVMQDSNYAQRYMLLQTAAQVLRSLHLASLTGWENMIRFAQLHHELTLRDSCCTEYGNGSPEVAGIKCLLEVMQYVETVKNQTAVKCHPGT